MSQSKVNDSNHDAKKFVPDVEMNDEAKDAIRKMCEKIPNEAESEF